MIDRRGFITTVGASILAAPLTPRAQAGQIIRIGVLDVVDAASNAANLGAFRQRLVELGYVEGQNLVVEYRSADNRAERFTDLAVELVQLKTDVIVTNGDSRSEEHTSELQSLRQ